MNSIEVLSRNGAAIRFLDEPTLEEQLAAVRQNPYVIDLIYNPFEEVQIQAIQLNPRIIYLIDYPSDDIVELANYLLSEE